MLYCSEPCLQKDVKFHKERCKQEINRVKKIKEREERAQQLKVLQDQKREQILGKRKRNTEVDKQIALLQSIKMEDGIKPESETQNTFEEQKPKSPPKFYENWSDDSMFEIISPSKKQKLVVQINKADLIEEEKIAQPIDSKPKEVTKSECHTIQ